MKRLAMGLFLVACGHTEPQTAPSASPPAIAGTASVAPKPVATARPAKDAPKVVTTIIGPGQLEVEANGVSLASDVVIDGKGRGETSAFKPVITNEPYLLAESCGARPAPGACSTPDHPIHPVAWTGMTCGSQCPTGCRANVPVGPGTFRFVVSSCDRKTTYPSPEFEFGGADDMQANDRHWAAKSTKKGSIARLELPIKWDATTAPSATTIAGMTIEGNEQPLDDETRMALAGALDSTTGYDDRIAKRCAMGKLVGFKLTRTLPTTSDQAKEQTNEIAVDFTCQKIFISRGDHAPRLVHASHFDPSRPAFVAIAKKYFADID